MLAFLFTINSIFTQKHDSTIKSEKQKENHKIQLVVLAKEQKLAINQKIVEGNLNVVFDGLTLNELAEKIEKNLGSTLKGKGYLFASYATSIGLDPYLAVAIILQETGCKWNCSSMVRDCYNVGGIKGGPTCGSSSYRAYQNLDEGIKGFMDVLYHNYYSKGLVTPEEINPSYAESTLWSFNVRKYMNQIKES